MDTNDQHPLFDDFLPPDDPDPMEVIAARSTLDELLTNMMIELTLLGERVTELTETVETLRSDVRYLTSYINRE